MVAALAALGNAVALTRGVGVPFGDLPGHLGFGSGDDISAVVESDPSAAPTTVASSTTVEPDPTTTAASNTTVEPDPTTTAASNTTVEPDPTTTAASNTTVEPDPTTVPASSTTAGGPDPTTVPASSTTAGGPDDCTDGVRSLFKGTLEDAFPEGTELTFFSCEGAANTTLYGAVTEDGDTALTVSGAWGYTSPAPVIRGVDLDETPAAVAALLSLTPEEQQALAGLDIDDVPAGAGAYDAATWAGFLRAELLTPPKLKRLWQALSSSAHPRRAAFAVITITRFL